jgi:hypothetical protein
VKHTPIAPARATLLTIAALVPTLTAGCGGDEVPSGVTVVQELRGDTVVMVSSGEPERVRIEAVEVLWQSDEFEGIYSRMARLGDHLVIGDRRRVHVVSIQDGGGHTFGRGGEGPAEFQQVIWSLGGFGTDTIATFDGFRFSFSRWMVSFSLRIDRPANSRSSTSQRGALPGTDRCTHS